MTQELEKAKQILGKPFCFMQWQAGDAKARDQEPMEEEDIRYLVSLTFTPEKCAYFDMCEKGGYDSEELFAAIEDSNKEGLSGIWMIGATLNARDGQELKRLGYRIRIEWIGSTMCDEIYFSEEACIKAELSAFQNLFSGITSLVGNNLI